MTKRQYEVLAWMAEHDDAEPDNIDDGELVYERGVAYIGATRVSPRTLFALLCAMAISASQDTVVGKFERYRINETGRALLKEGTVDA